VISLMVSKSEVISFMVAFATTSAAAGNTASSQWTYRLVTASCGRAWRRSSARCWCSQPIRQADRPISEDVVRIAKLGDLPVDIASHVLRHSFAGLAADLSYTSLCFGWAPITADATTDKECIDAPPWCRPVERPVVADRRFAASLQCSATVARAVFRQTHTVRHDRRQHF
jgi:hypothetical protein